LRNALDWLRDELIPLYEARAGELLRDPWTARNDYIFVILDGSPKSIERFFVSHACRELSDVEKVTVLQLLELQRHAMLMYTSCGWFFDEISGIETVQVIQYAARAIQGAREIFGQDFEPGFLVLLQNAPSNIPEHVNGRIVYEKLVKPAMIDWEKLVAHYSISSIFQAYTQTTKIFLYSFEERERFFAEAGRARLAVGTVKVTFDKTKAGDTLSYGVLYLGEHNLTAAVRRFETPELYSAMLNELRAAFDTADFPLCIRLLDRHLGASSYSLKSLFKDERRRIVDLILTTTREDLENRYRLITDRYTPLMRFLHDLGAPMPPALQTAADVVLEMQIRRELQAEQTDLERLRSLLDEARTRHVALFDADLSYEIKCSMERLIDRFAADPNDTQALITLEGMARLIRPLPLNLNLWKVQNSYYEMLQKVGPWFQKKVSGGDEKARVWIDHFLGLGSELNFVASTPPI